MSKYLHYAGDQIALAENTDLNGLEQQISGAAVDGVHWFSISDADNNTHRIRVNAAIPIRFSETATQHHASFGFA